MPEMQHSILNHFLTGKPLTTHLAHCLLLLIVDGQQAQPHHHGQPVAVDAQHQRHGHYSAASLLWNEPGQRPGR